MELPAWAVLDAREYERCCQFGRDVRDLFRPRQLIRNLCELPKTIGSTVVGIGALVLVLVMSILEFLFLIALPFIGIILVGYVLAGLATHFSP